MLALLATALGLGTYLAGSASAALRFRPLRAELARARWDADHDALTGLANRSGLRRRFECDRDAGRTHAAILLDLDAFKAVNDTWGHQAGDALLGAVADRLTRTCPAAAEIGRLGGDEFLVLLPWTGRADAIAAVQDMVTRLGLPITVPTGTVRVSASVGIAGPDPDGSWSRQLGRADAAMYRAKARLRRAGCSAWAFAESETPADSDSNTLSSSSGKQPERAEAGLAA